MKKLLQYLKEKGLYSLTLHAIVIVLAAEVIILAKQNNELKNSSNTQDTSVLQTGDPLFFEGVEALEHTTAPDTTRERQLIFMITTTCPFCKNSIPVWAQLAPLAEQNLSIFMISLDNKEKTLAYLKENNLQYPTFILTDEQEFRERYKLRGVPKTIIRSASGRVEKVWNGQFREENLAEAEETISHYNTLSYQHN